MTSSTILTSKVNYCGPITNFRAVITISLDCETQNHLSVGSMIRSKYETDGAWGRSGWPGINCSRVAKLSYHHHMLREYLIMSFNY